MKKIILLLSIVCIFCFTSCNLKIKPKTITGSNMPETTTDTSQTDSTDTSISDYDDGDVWEGDLF